MGQDDTHRLGNRVPLEAVVFEKKFHSIVPLNPKAGAV